MGKSVTKAQKVPMGGGGRLLFGWVLRLVLVLVLVAGWAAWELHAVDVRAAARIQNATAAAAGQLDAFLTKIATVTGQFSATADALHNRVGIAARMLKVETALAPAQNLFLYDAAGHFIAATLPLLPDDADASGRGWFEATAVQPGKPLFTATGDAPLGQGEGFVISQALLTPSGDVAGVIGTFIEPLALRAVITPAWLPPGASISFAEAGARGPLLAFTAGRSAPHPLLAEALGWIGLTPRIGEIAQLPQGLVLHMEADVAATATSSDRQTVLWHGAAVALGIVLLLWLIRPRHRVRALLPVSAIAAPVPEKEWGWEIDARGRLVGVAGNAPQPLLAAVGTNFLDLVTDDDHGKDLREAIAERTPVQDLELGIMLPGNPSPVARRFRVNGRFVADTGGFWGTAEEIGAMDPAKEAAD
ncbi:MAG: PDC sensor domain-containing protein [Acetobacteraceae bacterium]